MTKQRKLELIRQFTEILEDVKKEWIKEVSAEGEKPEYTDFRIHIIMVGNMYLDSLAFTDEEKQDFSKTDYTLIGNLRIILEIVLGQMWLEW